MCLKEVSAITISLAFCVQLAKAENLHNQRDTSRIKGANPKNLISSKNTSFQSIDTLTIKHENDLGNNHFESLLAKRFSPLKLKMETTKNTYVQDYINKFTANNYRFHLSKMLGLSSYYFPIFERAFRETGIPQEIKYLAIIESALNPNAVSRVGATGPWQFMHATAKGYGLTIDSYIDERKDPIAASYAAANYLKEAFDVYQDWFLAIASYNCGQGNVNRAIKRSGLSNPNFWQIRHLLPNETRNYVPAFIAMHHVLENHQKYGINIDDISISTQTEVIMVDRKVSLTSIAEALDLRESEIIALNPAYKRKVINGSKEKTRRLIVPRVQEAAYNDLYYALQGEPIKNSQAQVILASSKQSPKKTTSKHRVEKGETLEKIATKHNVTVQDLRAWNKLKNHIIVPGQQLTINNDTSPAPSKATQFITYKVKKGDTLSTIAKRYNIKNIEELKAMNNLKSDFLKSGMTLTITKI